MILGMVSFVVRRCVRWAGTITAALVLMITLADAINTLPKRKRAKGRQASKAEKWSLEHSRGVEIAIFMVGLLLLPPIIGFIYNVYHDPATPTVLRNASDLLTERTMGFLSPRSARSGNQRKDD